MKNKIAIFTSLIVLTINGFSQVNAENTNRKNALNVFMDCGFCDMDYVRREVKFVNYVRDRKEADVVILGTSQETGSKGDEYILTFLGYKKYKGINDTLKYDAPPSSTTEEHRKAILKIFKLGLIRYVSHTPYISYLEINSSLKKTENDSTKVKETEAVDKWNNWVFRIGTDAWLNGESTSQSTYMSNTISAQRVTEKWKYDFKIRNSYNQSNYNYQNFKYIKIVRNYGFSGSVIKSAGEHWAIGLFNGESTNTYNNYKFLYNLRPAIEYNVFKYSESAHKELRISYGISHIYAQYIDTTIFNKTQENLFKHSLSVDFQITQPWGSISTSFWASDYLHDYQLYNTGVWAYINWRIVKGLSFYTNFSASIVHDQIYLPKEEASIEDLLVRSRSMPTTYNYYMSIGLSYTFGSIYNNIVNPRFD